MSAIWRPHPPAFSMAAPEDVQVAAIATEKTDILIMTEAATLPRPAS